MKNFLAVCLNPTFQRTVLLENLEISEVNRALKARLDVSGKGGNVARVLKQLGKKVVYLTHVGPGKEEFFKLCREECFNVVYTETGSPIRTCTTLIDKSGNTTTEIIEPTLPVEPETTGKITELYKEQLKKSDWIIISGSKTPGYPETLFADFCRLAMEKKIPVIADYRGKELTASLPYKPYVVKINLVEFVQSFMPGVKASESDDSLIVDSVAHKAAELSKDGINYVITRGARKVIVASGGLLNYLKPPEITPVNTIGSGDSVTAGIAAALSEGAGLIEAVSEGIKYGALNAQNFKPGSIIRQ